MTTRTEDYTGPSKPDGEPVDPKAPEHDPEDTPQDDPDTVAPVSPSEPGPTQPGKGDEDKQQVGVGREMDAIVPISPIVTLSNGTDVEVVRLKTREFFRLMRIITHGALPSLMSMQVDFEIEDDQFMQRLLSIIVMAIPDSENESIEFIQSVVEPTGLIEGKKLTKTQIEHNLQRRIDLQEILANPPIDDTLTIITKVVEQEAEDIQGLGKKLRAMWDMARKTVQTQDKNEQSES